MSKYSRIIINPMPGYMVMAADRNGTILIDSSESAGYQRFLMQQKNRQTEKNAQNLRKFYKNETKSTEFSD